MADGALEDGTTPVVCDNGSGMVKVRVNSVLSGMLVPIVCAP